MNIQAPAPGYRQRIIFIIFSLLTTVTVFIYLAKTITIDQLLSIIRGIHLPWIALFFFLSFCMSVLRTWRYQVALNAAGHHPNNVALFLITVVRNFFSDLLPARMGTLIYIYLVQTRLGIPFSAAATSFAFAFVFDMIALAVLIIPAVLIVSSETIALGTALIFSTLLLIGSLVFLSLLPNLLHWTQLILRNKKTHFIPLREPLAKALNSFHDDVILARKQSIYWRIFALSIGVRCCKYLTLYTLLLALVVPLGFTVPDFPLPKVFLGLCSAELAASLPISGIAGFGAYEGAWALVFQLLGYTEQIAALTAISHHLITQIYGYSLGVFALLILLLPLFKKEETAATSTPYRSRFFWPQLFAIASSMVIAGLWLFNIGSPVTPYTKTAMLTGPELVDVAEPANLPMGKLVFQRTDGLYISTFGKGKKVRTPVKITDNGSKPRWSPDGNNIAYIYKSDIMLHRLGKNSSKNIAYSGSPRTLCFHPDGKSVLFTDGNSLKAIRINRGKVKTLFKAPGEIREISISRDGKFFALTLKTRFGFQVQVYDVNNKEFRKVSGGCSANINPQGTIVTVNSRDHRKLLFFDVETFDAIGSIHAPAGSTFDNHVWTNHPLWITSIKEGKNQNVYLHNKKSDHSFQLTTIGGCLRADAHIEK